MKGISPRPPVFGQTLVVNVARLARLSKSTVRCRGRRTDIEHTGTICRLKSSDDSILTVVTMPLRGVPLSIGPSPTRRTATTLRQPKTTLPHSSLSKKPRNLLFLLLRSRYGRWLRRLLGGLLRIRPGWMRLGRRSRRDQGFYGEMLKLLYRTTGLAKPSHLTPLEFLALIQDHAPHAYESAARLTHLHNEQAYAGKRASGEDQVAIENALSELRDDSKARGKGPHS